MEKHISKNNDLDDVFYSDIDEFTSQKIINQIEDYREKDSIKNSSYNEAYLSVCNQENKESYDEGFLDGKNYSLDFGVLLGKIEGFLNLNANNLLIVDINDIEMVKVLKEDLENYNGKLSQKVIEEFYNKFSTVLKKYLNFID